jgi:hypothetical protein
MGASFGDEISFPIMFSNVHIQVETWVSVVDSVCNGGVCMFGGGGVYDLRLTLMVEYAGSWCVG